MMVELIFFYIMSRSPVLSTTLDEKFHNIDRAVDIECLNKIRFSLLSFGLGKVKIYFVTYRKDLGFKLIYLLSIEELFEEKKSGIEEKVNNYKKHLQTREANEVEKEREFLLYKIDQETAIGNYEFQKATNYTTLILVLIPIIITLGTSKLDQINRWHEWTFFGIILYSILNVSLYIFQFHKVKEVNRSMFKELKSKREVDNGINELYYCDWSNLKMESTLLVSYVANIERYMRYALMAYLLLIISLNANLSFSSSGGVSSESVNMYNFTSEISDSDKKEVIELLMDFNDFNKPELIIIVRSASGLERSYRYLELVDTINFIIGDECDVIEVYETSKEEQITVLMKEE